MWSRDFLPIFEAELCLIYYVGGSCFIYVICIYFVGGSCFIYVIFYLFTHTGVQHDFHVTWCLCRLTVTRRVSLVEQEPLNLPEHQSSLPVYIGVRVAWSSVFCVTFCRSMFVLFLLAIVFPVLLRFKTSDYPFGIFKLFLLQFLKLWKINLLQYWHMKLQSIKNVLPTSLIEDENIIILFISILYSGLKN